MEEESRPILNGEGSHTDQEITQQKIIDIELTEVTGISICPENVEWYNYDIIGSMLPRNASSSSALRTPKLGNTVLHIAAWQGNYDCMDIVVRESPNLLFELNANKDTPLHVAARVGHFHIFEKLLAAYAKFERKEIAMAWLKYTESSNPVKMRNNEGNTVLHEAATERGFLYVVFKAFEPYINIGDPNGESLAESCYKYALNIVNNAKKSAFYMAVEAGDIDVVELVLDKCPRIVESKGLSPVVPAIMKQDKDMLIMILEKRPKWIHLTEENGRIPLHHAAFKGFLEGVRLIIEKCKCCVFRSDQDGYFPIHLAAYGGHVKVVKELLNYYKVPAEMLDNYQRNILHIAAKNGNHDVVHYILKNRNLVDMINQKDCNGDTPLHLATRFCHPKAVYYFTWNERVHLDSVNFNKQTPLDIIYELYQLKGNPTLIKKTTNFTLST